VAVIQLLFDQCSLYNGIPLQSPRYEIFVTLHVAVLSFCSINTSYVPLLTFNSHDIQLLSLHMNSTTFTFRSIHVKNWYSPSLPKIFNLCHYIRGSITDTVRSEHVMYRYFPSIHTIHIFFHYTCRSIKLLFYQYKLCTGINFPCHDIQLLSLYMWQYFNYSLISTQNIQIIPLTSQGIQLLSQYM